MTVIDRRDEDGRQVEPGLDRPPVGQSDSLEQKRPVVQVVIPGGRGQSRIEPNVEDVLQEGIEVVGPAGGDDAGADRVFEDQVPADDPGDQLAQRRIGVGIGAAGHRHHAGQLRVAERGEAAADGRQQEREHERRAGEPPWRRCPSGRRARCRSWRRCPAGQRDGSQPPLQPLAVVHLTDQLLDVFPPKELDENNPIRRSLPLKKKARPPLTPPAGCSDDLRSRSPCRGWGGQSFGAVDRRAAHGRPAHTARQASSRSDGS